MAMKVTDDCTGCGYCITRCPVQAIVVKDDGQCQIDPDKCVECKGYNESPTCAEVCSVGCIVKA